MSELAPTFSLVLWGNSMDAAGLMPGTRLTFRRQNFARHGDVVAVELGDHGTTIKRFTRVRHHGAWAVWLRPESTDPIHEPIRWQEGWRILGVAKDVPRRRPTPVGATPEPEQIPDPVYREPRSWPLNPLLGGRPPNQEHLRSFQALRDELLGGRRRQPDDLPQERYSASGQATGEWETPRQRRERSRARDFDWGEG